MKMQPTIRRTIEARLAWLKSTDPFVRLDAVQVIGNLADEAAFDPLIFALWDENVYVRAYAAEALGKLRDNRAIAALTASMHDREFFVRAHVVLAMGELQSPEAVNPLFRLLLEGEEEIKPYAVWALGTLEEQGAVTSLCLRSLIHSLQTGSTYEQVGRAFSTMSRQYPEIDTGEAGRKARGSFAGAISVSAARITYEDKAEHTLATVKVAGHLRAPLSVNDVLAMTLNGVELFSKPLSSFQLISAESPKEGPSDRFVPAQYGCHEKHLKVGLCAVTGAIRVEALKVKLGMLDSKDAVEVAVWRNDDMAVDNFDVVVRGGSLVFPAGS